MKQWIALALTLVCVLTLVSCSENPLAKNTQVFETENITRITFYTERTGEEAFEVPGKYMDEITAWLGTFTINDMGKVSEQAADQAAGTNHTSVKIEYSDGTVVKSGLTTTWFGAAEYEMQHEAAPACYHEIMGWEQTS